MRLRAYECGVRGTEFHRVVHAETPGKAKYEYWRDVKEPYPGIPYTSVTCHVIGPPQTDDSFRRTAEYRGVPFARVGMSVIVGDEKRGEWHGVIVGNNSSANFDVLFDGGPYVGERLNCHPNWQMRFFGADGAEVKRDAD